MSPVISAPTPTSPICATLWMTPAVPARITRSTSIKKPAASTPSTSFCSKRPWRASLSIHPKKPWYANQAYTKWRWPAAGRAISILCMLDSSHKRYQAAKCRLTPIELPRETANPYTLVQHLVNHTASVLNMEDSMGKHIIVHKLQVIVRPDFLERLAQLPRAFGRQVGTHFANNRVHRVIHRTGIDREPGYLALQHPVDKLTLRPRMFDEITCLVRL